MAVYLLVILLVLWALVASGPVRRYHNQHPRALLLGLMIVPTAQGTWGYR